MQIKYIDNRKIYIAQLTNYPRGISLPSNTNILTVTPGEFMSLLKIKNGKNVCFEEVKTSIRNQETNPVMEA